jgi:hypothetical protein
MQIPSFFFEKSQNIMPRRLTMGKHALASCLTK